MVVLDAPGATLAGNQMVAGCFGGGDAPGAKLAESRTLAERFAQGSTPEDRGRTRSATNVNWIAFEAMHTFPRYRRSLSSRALASMHGNECIFTPVILGILPGTGCTVLATVRVTLSLTRH